MMRQKIMKVMSVVVIMGLLVSNTVWGVGVRKTIYIPKKGAGETEISQTRTTKYSYVQAANWAVYPTETGMIDNFTKIRLVIRNANNKIISSTIKAPCNSLGEVVLEEGRGTKNIYLHEGYLNTKNIKFCFYGNSEKYPAWADVFCYGN